MPSLRDVQAAIRSAVVADEGDAVAPLLTGGADPQGRLAVHQRHYQASLVSALLDRHPATVWLAGSEFVTAAATAFVAAHPPQRPCIAEYGRAFPAFVPARPGAAALPYLRDFMELERRFGEAAIEVTLAAVDPARAASLDEAAAGRLGVTLQPGVRLLRVSWPVDDLLTLYLTDSAPDRLALAPQELRLQLFGARGEVLLERLPEGDYMFRDSLAGGASLERAAALSVDADADFDPTLGLAALLGAGLVTAFAAPPLEGRS